MVIQLSAVIKSYSLKIEQKKTVWLFYSAFDEARKTSVRCMDCNAELSARVLRWKSHQEMCPWQGRNSTFFLFSIE